MSAPRLVVVALVLASSTACIKARVAVVVEADGSGTYSSEMAFTPPTAKAFHDLAALDPVAFDLSKLNAAFPHAPDKAGKKAMKAAGLSKVKVEADPEAMSATISGRFDGPASLAGLAAVSPSQPTLGLTQSDMTHGAVTMATNQAMSPPSDAGAPKPDMPPEAMAQMMGIMGTLMAEMNNLSVVTSITVPGTITGVSPSLGAAFAGDTATWTIDAAAMGAMMAGGADPEALKGQFGAGMRVDFTPDEPLPTSVWGR